MRYFKHMNDASEDGFMEDLFRKFGHMGTDVWWRLMEKVVREGKPSEVEAEYYPSCPQFSGESWEVLGISWDSLRQKARTKSPTLRQVLTFCRQRSKIFWEESEKLINLHWPNILRLKDEYTERVMRGRDTTSPMYGRKGKGKGKGKGKEDGKCSGGAALSGGRPAGAQTEGSGRPIDPRVKKLNDAECRLAAMESADRGHLLTKARASIERELGRFKVKLKEDTIEKAARSRAVEMLAGFYEEPKDGKTKSND